MNFLKSIYNYIAASSFFYILFYVACFYLVLKFTDGMLLISIVLGIFLTILSDIEGHLREIKTHFIPVPTKIIPEHTVTVNDSKVVINKEQVFEEEFEQYSTDETHVRAIIALLRKVRVKGSHNIDWYLESKNITMKFRHDSLQVEPEAFFLNAYNEWDAEINSSSNGVIMTKQTFDKELNHFIQLILNIVEFFPNIEADSQDPIDNIDWYLGAINQLLMVKLSVPKEQELNKFLNSNGLTLDFTEVGFNGSDKETPVIEEFINLYLKWEDSTFGNSTLNTESYINGQKINFADLLKELFIIK